MPISNTLAVVGVADFDSALAWYERLLGRPADERPMVGLAQWQLTETGGIQLLRDPDRAGTASVTLIVDDLKDHVAFLTGSDFTVDAITTGEMARFVAISDLEGNTITFAEPLSTDD